MRIVAPASALDPAARGLADGQREAAHAESHAFLADWEKTVFVHLAVEPRFLQPFVPFTLDVYEGLAYVSLVAFTMRHMRPGWCDGPLGEMALRPICPCRFLNARTYVRAGSSDGIYFLAEWLSAWASIPLGPIIYGLPYRPGRLKYASDPEAGTWEVSVRSITGGELRARGAFDATTKYIVARPGSLDEFLLERYTAFTLCRGEARAFRVDHAPWPHVRTSASLRQGTLLASTGDWVSHAQLAGAHYSPGAFNVGMGAPSRLGTAALRPRGGRAAFSPEAFD